MKMHNYETIKRLLQPVMDFMAEEYPNDCKLIVEPNFAQIVYNHTDMTFISDRIDPTQTEGEK